MPSESTSTGTVISSSNGVSSNDVGHRPPLAEIPAPTSERDHRCRSKVVGVLLVIAAAAATTTLATRALRTGTTTFGGFVESGTVVYLDFAASGPLSALDVRPGQRVEAGQILAVQQATPGQAAIVASDYVAIRADQEALFNLRVVAAESGSIPQKLVTEDQQAVAGANARVLEAKRSSVQQIGIATNAVTLANQEVSRAVSDAQAACAAATESIAQCSRSEPLVSAAEGALGRAQGALGRVQDSAQRVSTESAAGLAKADARLAAAERAAATSIAAQVYADEAVLARDQAQLLKDKIEEAATTIVAAGAGWIAAINGSPGDMAGPGGTRQPTLQSQPGQSSLNFSLLPVSTSGGSSSLSPASDSSDEPLIEMATGPGLVVTQVPERDIGEIGPGVVARVRIPALGRRFNASFLRVEPNPLSLNGGVVFDVVFALPGSLPPGVLAGMSADAQLHRAQNRHR